MRHSSTAFIFLLAVAAQARAAIDFTPTLNRYYSEGAEYFSVSFKEDKQTISMGVPRLWSCRGDASRLLFAPPDQSFAEGVVQAVPAKGAQPFDEPTVKALEMQVMSTLPPGSQGAAVLSRLENPVILYQNLSYEFVVSYQTLGQLFQRSVIFVNCADKQLVFRFSAPKAVFENLNKAFRRSIYSWQLTEQPATTSAGPITAAR
jgi:hypothetical protein